MATPLSIAQMTWQMTPIVNYGIPSYNIGDFFQCIGNLITTWTNWRVTAIDTSATLLKEWIELAPATSSSCADLRIFLAGTSVDNVSVPSTVLTPHTNVANPNMPYIWLATNVGGTYAGVGVDDWKTGSPWASRSNNRYVGAHKAMPQGSRYGEYLWAIYSDEALALYQTRGSDEYTSEIVAGCIFVAATTAAGDLTRSDEGIYGYSVTGQYRIPTSFAASWTLIGDNNTDSNYYWWCGQQPSTTGNVRYMTSFVAMVHPAGSTVAGGLQGIWPERMSPSTDEVQTAANIDANLSYWEPLTMQAHLGTHRAEQISFRYRTYWSSSYTLPTVWHLAYARQIFASTGYTAGTPLMDAAGTTLGFTSAPYLTYGWGPSLLFLNQRNKITRTT